MKQKDNFALQIIFNAEVMFLYAPTIFDLMVKLYTTLHIQSRLQEFVLLSFPWV
jgi:hypothetical protein